jgi:hypothetical protein
MVTCPKCKQRFEYALIEPNFDSVAGQPAPKAEGTGYRVIPPWENRTELGLWQAIYQTLKGVLFTPGNLFQTMTFEGGIREPLAFGLLIGSIGSMFGFFWQFLILSDALSNIGQHFLGELTLDLIFLGIILLSPFFVVINLFFSSAIVHVLLLLVRGGKNGFEATFRVMSYCQATQILAVIPYVGGFIAGMWFLIVQFIGLRAIHEISTLRIIMAFLIPVPIFFLILAGVMIILFL